MQKYGILTLVGLCVALAALYWIDPLTAAGRTVLVTFVVLFVNALGGLLWRQKKDS